MISMSASNLGDGTIQYHVTTPATISIHVCFWTPPEDCRNPLLAVIHDNRKTKSRPNMVRHLDLAPLRSLDQRSLILRSNDRLIHR